MERPIVKISIIKINDFKNVRSGIINTGIKNIKTSNLIGVYGQNGSGKTTLIDALAILKLLLCGQSIPEEYCNFINISSEKSSFEYTFLIQLFSGEEVKVKYSFSIKKESVSKNNNQIITAKNNVILKTADGKLLTVSNKTTENKIVVYDEILSYSIKRDDKWTRNEKIIVTSNCDTFTPRKKYDLLIGKDDSSDLIVAKRICLSESRSYAFSYELLSEIYNNSDDNYEKRIMKEIISSLVSFGNEELFIINTSNHALISLNTLPMSFRYDGTERREQGSIALPLDKSIIIPEESITVVKNVINNMNSVLKAIIPDLTIGIKELNSQLMKNGEIGKCIELISKKNSKEIPLKYESEGIKKIISILQLLIVVFNQPSITVAIDELDSGIFEYLLGELLQIIGDKGKGQLFFTSHNLRPLETLDKKMLYFTTTNPLNRYVKMINLKPNNNLRDFYYRNILLGGQQEELYQSTDNFAISMAFRKAGKNGN